MWKCNHVGEVYSFGRKLFHSQHIVFQRGFPSKWGGRILFFEGKAAVAGRNFCSQTKTLRRAGLPHAERAGERKIAKYTAGDPYGGIYVSSKEEKEKVQAQKAGFQAPVLCRSGRFCSGFGAAFSADRHAAYGRQPQ